MNSWRKSLVDGLAVTFIVTAFILIISVLRDFFEAVMPECEGTAALPVNCREEPTYWVNVIFSHWGISLGIVLLMAMFFIAVVRRHPLPEPQEGDI